MHLVDAPTRNTQAGPVRGIHWARTPLSFLPRFLPPNLTDILIAVKPIATPGGTVLPWRLFLQLGGGPQTDSTREISAFISGCGETPRVFSTDVASPTQAVVV